MFGKFGQLASLLGNLPKIQEDLQTFQQTLGQITAEGDAGGGAVTVRVNGRMEMLSCRLLDSALAGNDKELLEELIRAATNQAVQRVRQAVAEAYGKKMMEMGLPAGMKLPGMP